MPSPLFIAEIEPQEPGRPAVLPEHHGGCGAEVFRGVTMEIQSAASAVDLPVIDFPALAPAYRPGIDGPLDLQADQTLPPPTPGVEDVSQFVVEHRDSGGLMRILGDALALLIAAVEAAVVQGSVSTTKVHGVVTVSFSHVFFSIVAVIPILVAVLGVSHGRSHVRRSIGSQVATVAPLLAIGGSICILCWHIMLGLGLTFAPTDDALLEMCGFAIITVTAARMAYEVPPADERGTRTRRVLLVGSGAVANRLIKTLQEDGGIRVMGFVDDDPLDDTGCIGKLNELSARCEELDVDHVIVAFSRSSAEEIIEALQPIQGRLPITVVPRLFDVLPVTANLHEVGPGIAGIGLPTSSLSGVPRFLKRSMDIVGAGAALIVLSPLLALVALVIKLTSPGAVLFHQERIGRRGETFEVVKFRSMCVQQADHDPASLLGQVAVGPFPKLKDDPRVTPVGRLIRKTSIDELPQLWNVLRGDMSLVGPRPFIPRESATISGWAQRRYSVRPGITGLWQVSGRNDVAYRRRVAMDTIYARKKSLVWDIKLLLLTVPAVLFASGSY